MTIELTRRALIVTLVLVGLVLAAMAAIALLPTGYRPANVPTATATAIAVAAPPVTADPRPTLAPVTAAPLPGEPTAAAAVLATHRFYTVDYRDPDGWLAAMTEIASSDGVAILAGLVQPTLWPELVAAQVITPADAISVHDDGLQLEGVSPLGGAFQIRTVTVSLDPAHTWPGMDDPDFAANVLLLEEDGAWRFVSFLDAAQVALFAEATP